MSLVKRPLYCCFFGESNIGGSNIGLSGGVSVAWLMDLSHNPAEAGLWDR